ncbi:MAG: SCO family protein [Ignavibacterium sp.]|jgi:protein SCO1/2|nr:SCO family protein [Ignavibacterium sp.]
MKNQSKIFWIIILLSFITICSGCDKRFPLEQDIFRTQNTFFNQDSIQVEFPEIIKDKITLFTMIYTHCPDICPMTTHNMSLVEQRLPDNVKDRVRFVVISFDPKRDTPSIFKKYAEIRDLSFSTWSFLSGDEKNTNEVMLKFDIVAIPADSTYDDDGTLSYNVIHTDRISLIDQNGKLRANYKGSTADLNMLIEDIKYLAD